MKNLIHALQDWWYRPSGCTCDLPARAAGNRHRVMGLPPLYKCMRRWRKEPKG